ncbi:hypothetical protein J437_LFUL015055 [Ladona fulva]|uniref:Leucine-rich repeat and WD repeat-containing protein 1 WD domain-containing protein n=1 Tax=Ladona fulva TaxID=123851 RepID=A0A8K0K4L4_LADFU|nr:hypothetical protein J437_LFUL015055 [Ladona fulva]
MKRKLNYEDDGKTTLAESHIPEVNFDVNSFEPLHFLRCHSKKNDPADVQTQVWQCAFEPDVDSPGSNTDILASCGGNSVCFIDSITGNVISKFYPEKPNILLYALAWTTIRPGGGRRCNILAVGGTGSSNYGAITAWDISDCHPWSNDIKLKPVITLSAHSEVFSLSISKNLNILLAGCSSGLYGWCLEDINWNEPNSNKNRLLSCIEFELPETDDNAHVNNVRDSEEESLVDSVVCIPGSSLVALKVALRGVIYIWDLQNTIEEEDTNSKVKLGFKGAKLKINPVKYLKWSDTDDYFMSMGCSPDGRFLACGDDEGAIWLYNLSTEEQEQKAKKQKMDVTDELVKQPSQRLLWPENLEDEEVRNARKVKCLEGHGGVIDQVALGIGQNGSLHLAAVTSTNLVCIWRAVSEGNFQDSQYFID